MGKKSKPIKIVCPACKKAVPGHTFFCSEKGCEGHGVIDLHECCGGGEKTSDEDFRRMGLILGDKK